MSCDTNDSAKCRVDAYNIKKGFLEERLWRIKLCWMQAMVVQTQVLYIRKEKKKMIIWN